MSNWRGGAIEGALYRIGADDLDRVGSCWMKGRLKIGDLVLCIKHSGGCFYDYILVTEYANPSIQGIPGSMFGAYTLGKKEAELNYKDFHLVAAGESVAR